MVLFIIRLLSASLIKLDTFIRRRDYSSLLSLPDTSSQRYACFRERFHFSRACQRYCSLSIYFYFTQAESKKIEAIDSICVCHRDKHSSAANTWSLMHCSRSTNLYPMKCDSCRREIFLLTFISRDLAILADSYIYPTDNSDTTRLAHLRVASLARPARVTRRGTSVSAATTIGPRVAPTSKSRWLSRSALANTRDTTSALGSRA